MADIRPLRLTHESHETRGGTAPVRQSISGEASFTRDPLTPPDKTEREIEINPDVMIDDISCRATQDMHDFPQYCESRGVSPRLLVVILVGFKGRT